MTVISHNLVAMNARRQLNITTGNQAKTMERLSSGYRINRAADDAAGLAISEKMRRQIRGLTQGVRNTQDGVALCQVADGALAEVDEMLHRITELSVKAANGTNTPEDRQYIQEEIHELVAEIDRIGDTTTFNERPVFQGYDEVLMNTDGSVLIQGDIPFSDFKITDVNLGTNPFSSGDNANHLALQAIVDNPDSSANGKTYNLIYGMGSTSYSSFRLSYSDGVNDKTEIVNMENLTGRKYSGSLSSGLSRTFEYSNSDGINMEITQVVRADNSNSNNKKYNIQYLITNKTGAAAEVKVDFMFHCDTAYNNNDLCEGYFSGGTRIGANGVYKGMNSMFSGTNPNIHGNSLASLSIVDTEKALAFSEKVDFYNSPDVSIGHYYNIRDWGYYNDLDSNSNLGVNTQNEDLGFSAIWHDTVGAGATSHTVNFDYGIVSTADDHNLHGQTVNKDTSATTFHYDKSNIWIQSGAEKDHGMYLCIDEMNTEILGIDRVDVTTAQGALEAVRATGKALRAISKNRSGIGAQQNRLEHTISNEENIVENTTAAESAIRDADMSSEMVKLSLQNILMQSGQAMLAQANQTKQGILSLIQQ